MSKSGSQPLTRQNYRRAVDGTTGDVAENRASRSVLPSFAMRRWSLASVGSVLLLTIAACGGDGDTSSAPASSAGSAGAAGNAGGPGSSGAAAGKVGASGSSGAAAGLVGAFAAEGLTAQPGTYAFLDLASCCDASCSGNNPASPYATFWLPPSPGATTPDPSPDPDKGGAASAIRMRADEAVVFVGPTPPEVRYFGFTPYLLHRFEGGKQRAPFASLAETLNNDVIAVDAPLGAPVFERPTAIVVAFDQTTDARARKALVAAGVAPSSINTIAMDATQARLGLGADADTFATLIRVALFASPDAKAQYLASPKGQVFRVTPTNEAPPVFFPKPAARAKNATNTELSLAPAVDALRAAIVAAHPDLVADDLEVGDGVADPEACIAGTVPTCAGDNRDTLYPQAPTKNGNLSVIPLFTAKDERYFVYGVNHDVTGKTRYASLSVYALEHLVGIAGVTSAEYAGSAQKFLPAHPDAPSLYAWEVARTCAGGGCLAVPTGGCPTGIDQGKLGFFAFRTYLEPGTGTAPATDTLVRDRVLRFRKK